MTYLMEERILGWQLEAPPSGAWGAVAELAGAEQCLQSARQWEGTERGVLQADRQVCEGRFKHTIGRELTTEKTEDRAQEQMIVEQCSQDRVVR